MAEEKNKNQEKEEAADKSKPSSKKESNKEGKINALAILSYLGILCLVPLLVKKDDKLVQFHAKQGLVLLILEIITMFISAIPLVGWIIAPIGWIIWVILSIVGILNVLNNREEEIPLIGGLGSKLKV